MLNLIDKEAKQDQNSKNKNHLAKSPNTWSEVEVTTSTATSVAGRNRRSSVGTLLASINSGVG
jgi:hypothetical protein